MKRNFSKLKQYVLSDFTINYNRVLLVYFVRNLIYDLLLKIPCGGISRMLAMDKEFFVLKKMSINMKLIHEK